MQEALGPERRHEAIFVTMQFGAGYEVNIFDLQVGCQYPLPLERAFLQNFLALATLAARHEQALRGHEPDDRPGDRRGLSALHRRARRIAEALPRGRRTRGRREPAKPSHRPSSMMSRGGGMSSMRSSRSRNTGSPEWRSAMPSRSCRT